MAYYRPARDSWELQLEKLPPYQKKAINRATRITKEVTRFKHGLIDIPELKRRLKSIL